MFIARFTIGVIPLPDTYYLFDSHSRNSNGIFGTKQPKSHLLSTSVH